MFVLLKGVDFHILTGAPSPGRPFTPSRTELLIASANSSEDNIPFLLFFQKYHGAAADSAVSIQPILTVRSPLGTDEEALFQILTGIVGEYGQITCIFANKGPELLKEAYYIPRALKTGANIFGTLIMVGSVEGAKLLKTVVCFLGQRWCNGRAHSVHARQRPVGN